SSGTSLTVDQIRLIKRFTPNVTVLYDGDAAGIKASLRGIDMLLEEGLNVKTLLLPDGEDPDSFARSHSVTALTDFIREHEEDFISFKTKILLADSRNDPIKRASVITDMVHSIAVIPDAIPRSVYVKECSKLMDIGEDVLTSEVAKLRKKKLYDAPADSKPAPEGEDGAQPLPPHTPAIPAYVENIFCREQEKELVNYLLKLGSEPLFNTRVASYIIAEIIGEGLDFQNLEYRQIFEEYKAQLEATDTVDVKHFINHADPKMCELTIDLLSPRYELSKIWSDKSKPNEERIRVAEGAQLKALRERLHVDVPKAIAVYKAKIVTQAVKRTQSELEGKSDEEQDLLLLRLGELNKLRTSLSEVLDRPVI
ncbi:MAG: toprim domain-containing protein, partial [Prevotellaceae bacterium]|nr:toprim domain-containing protein [Prevotellaceae bacterium]